MIISRGQMMVTWCENVKMHEYTLCFVFDKNCKIFEISLFYGESEGIFLNRKEFSSHAKVNIPLTSTFGRNYNHN